MYGYDADKLAQFIQKPKAMAHPWGESLLVVKTESYMLQRLAWHAAGVFSRHTHLEQGPWTLYVESGRVTAAWQLSVGAGKSVAVPAGKLVTIAAGELWQLVATEPAVVYGFCPRLTDGSRQPGQSGVVNEPADVRQKYWGEICTIVSNGQLAGKRLLLKAGISGSLEFHVKKHESYYVHSGDLAINFRAGRAENRLFRIPAGTAVTMPPGLMHQRGAITDAVVIEISTPDDDADSFLVEDGTKTPMPGFAELFVKREV